MRSAQPTCDTAFVLQPQADRRLTAVSCVTSRHEHPRTSQCARSEGNSYVGARIGAFSAHVELMSAQGLGTMRVIHQLPRETSPRSSRRYVRVLILARRVTERWVSMPKRGAHSSAPRSTWNTIEKPCKGAGAQLTISAVANYDNTTYIHVR